MSNREWDKQKRRYGKRVSMEFVSFSAAGDI